MTFKLLTSSIIYVDILTMLLLSIEGSQDHITIPYQGS